MSVSSRHNWRSTFYFHHSNAVNYFNNYKIYCEKNCVGILLCMQSLVGAASFIFLKGSFFFFFAHKKVRFIFSLNFGCVEIKWTYMAHHIVKESMNTSGPWPRESWFQHDQVQRNQTWASQLPSIFSITNEKHGNEVGKKDKKKGLCVQVFSKWSLYYGRIIFHLMDFTDRDNYLCWLY